MMRDCVKKGLLVFIFMILLLPVIQQNLPFVTSAQLKGYIEYAPDVTFNWVKWFDGSYQQGESKYSNDWTGFRADMVRSNNQIEFSLFKNLNYGGTILGLNDCLYFDNYIRAYDGLDFVGEQVIREKLLKLKAVSDTLARLGKSLVLIHAPNKACFYAEDIPEPFKHEKKGKTNLQTYLRIGDSLGINQVDFNGWFVSMKNTNRELLLSKQGTHWTNYGALIAGDSLIRYIEKLRNIKMVHPVWSAIEHTKKPSVPDADINDLLNLIYPAADETFSYANLKYPEDTTKKKPKMIFIGDSFVINMIKNWTIQSIATDWQFWFYFKYILNSAYPNANPDNPMIEHFDWKGELRKTDCVIILYTSVTLPGLGSGFIEQAYDYYYPKK